MTKDKALHAWFSQFLPAFPTSNVPEDATFPWLTYELITGSWESGEIALNSIPNAKAQEISDAIGMGGAFVPYDGGAMWIKRGSPWCQNIVDESDKNIKRRYLNITVEYLSQN